MLQNYFWIAIGGALGSMARYWCTGAAERLLGAGFPWGTLAINVVGSLVIGFFATITGPEGRIVAGMTPRLFVMAGICGGFTTFSAFSLQTLQLIDNGDWLAAGGYIAGSIMLCLLAVWLGHATAAALNAAH